MKTYTTGDIAKRLDIHPNTVRNWADEYSEHMSAGAQRRFKKYSHADVLILATIADYRNNGIPPDDIKKRLQAGDRVSEIPPLPTEEETAARAAIELVPASKLENALSQVVILEQQLTRLITERDSIRDASQQQLDQLNNRIVSLERELGDAKGRLDIVTREHSRMSQFVVWLGVALAVVAVALVALLAVLIVTGN